MKSSVAVEHIGEIIEHKEADVAMWKRLLKKGPAHRGFKKALKKDRLLLVALCKAVDMLEESER